MVEDDGTKNALYQFRSRVELRTLGVLTTIRFRPSTI